MLELCLADQHNNIFFADLFLQRLPRDIRVLLTHEDFTNLRCLAADADRLIAFGGRQDTVAADETLPEETVAAIKDYKHKGKQHCNNNQQQRSQQHPLVPPQPQSAQQSQKAMPPPAPAPAKKGGSGWLQLRQPCEMDSTFVDSPGRERCTVSGVEEGSRWNSRGVVRKQAEAGPRIHQEALRCEGVPQKQKLATSELTG